jgi:prophage antirepressor-like protein
MGVENMNNLEIVKSERFGEVSCDFLRDTSGEIFMTSDQLGRALGYSNPRQAISNLVNRNPYLENEDYSSVLELSTEKGMRPTRLFNEDGIYEVTFIAKTYIAINFRRWVTNIIKEIRKGNIVNVNSNNDAIKYISDIASSFKDIKEDLYDRIDLISERIESDITINSAQAKYLQFAIKSRVIELLGGKDSDFYNKYSRKFYGIIHFDIKREYAVPSYRDILKCNYNDAYGYISSWMPSENILM